jgi:hypothetical protein
MQRELNRIPVEMNRDAQEQLERLKAELGQAASSEERIRQEVERWANPILDAVQTLKRRLHNLLHQAGYPRYHQPLENRSPKVGRSRTIIFFQVLFSFSLSIFALCACFNSDFVLIYFAGTRKRMIFLKACDQ